MKCGFLCGERQSKGRAEDEEGARPEREKENEVLNFSAETLKHRACLMWEATSASVEGGFFHSLQEFWRKTPSGRTQLAVLQKGNLAVAYKLMQGITAARALGSDLFFVCDGYSFLVCALVSSHSQGRDGFSLLVSPVHTVAKSADGSPSPSVLVILLSLFYPSYRPANLLETLLAASSHGSPLTADGDGRVGAQEEVGSGKGKADEEEKLHPHRLIYPNGLAVLLDRLLCTLSPLPLANNRSFTLRLSHLLNRSETAFTWRGVLFTPSSRLDVVVKENRWPHFKEAVEREGGMLLSPPLVGLTGEVVPAYGLFEGDEKAFLVLEYGGKAYSNNWDAWRKMPLNERLSLFSSLVRLHDNHIQHNDIYARNAVLSREGKARWIDFGVAEGDHYCWGWDTCVELVEAREEMELEEGQVRGRMQESG